MATANPQARTIAQFRALHDKNVIIPNKIRKALERLREIGPEHFVYDEEFRQLCGIQGAELAAYRDQFARHWFMTVGLTKSKNDKRVWFGNSKVADRLRPEPIAKV